MSEPRSGAVFSACRLYRYGLWRHWGELQAPRMIIVGLNPSTADETVDDPTIRRCIGFAKREGFGGLTMLNLFALRATNPREMLAAADPVGPSNDEWLRHHAASPLAGVIVAAWGVLGAHRDRAQHVASLLPGLQCFGLTERGHPRHPLYLRADTPLIPFSMSGRT